MKKLSLLLTCLATSCVLPSFELVSTLDDSTGGRSPTAGTGSTQEGGTSAGPNGEAGDDSGSTTTAGAGGKSPSGGAGGTKNGGASSGTESGGADTGGTDSGGTNTGGTDSGGTNTGGSAPQCPTAPNDTLCQGACVDTKTSELHCGGCAKPCDANQECANGACACVAGYNECNGGCIKLDTDDNCGTCNKKCTGAQTCSAAACKVCPTGCAVLAAPFTKTSDNVNFELKLNPARNLTNAKISVWLYGENVSENLQFSLRVYNDQLQSYGVTLGFIGVSGWHELVYDLAISTVSVTASTKMLLSFTPAPSDTPVNTKIYIDSIVIDSGVAGPWNFTGSGAPLLFNNAQDDSVPSPSTVTGTVTWLGN